MIRRRGPAGDAAQSEELERLCDRLGRVEAPFDEITRSRAEARLAAELAREPARRYRRTLGWTVALVAVGAAAAGAFVARTVVPAAASRIAGSPERVAPLRTLRRRPDGGGGLGCGVVDRAGGAGATDLAPRRPGGLAGARVAG